MATFQKHSIYTCIWDIKIHNKDRKIEHDGRATCIMCFRVVF